MKYVSLAHTLARIYLTGFVILRPMDSCWETPVVWEELQETARTPVPLQMWARTGQLPLFLKNGPPCSLDRTVLVCLLELARFNLPERKGNFPQ